MSKALGRLLGVLIALTGRLAAACTLTGTVTADDLPLDHASIAIAYAGQEIGSGTTQADGRFSVSYPAFQPHQRAVTVTVGAAGFASDTRIFTRRGSAECLEPIEHRVVLERQATEGALPPPTTLGLTIFVASFPLFGEGADALAPQINADLPAIVHHRIVAYKSLLHVPTSQIDISVEPTEERLTSEQGERIWRVGRRLNALAMIAGNGELTTLPGGEPGIDLDSIFRTIPAYRDVAVIMQPIRDRLPSRRASPSRLAEGMQDLWGKQALISYVLQRMARHSGPWERSELGELRAILIEVRSTMTQDDQLLQPLNSLLAAIAAEHGV